nr:integrase, catalytic region, zinc finger, CCHC-type, peptidase aspartic, catalytic [Tanacetum cinerariifolium]
MHDSVQIDHVVDSHADYTSDSNMIPYDQYVKDNEVPVVHSDLSSVPNDAFMMIYNDMCEPHAQSVSNPSQNTVVKNSLTAELATYKEQVELYEQRAKFELTEQEQKINEQSRLVISDRNFKEPALYNGHEIIKDNHAPTIVYNTEDTLEMVEITRKKINAKMNNPECVTRKVKIAPHDYSKQNFLATFTPQKQLTPKQIFWSNDLIKLKSKALKEQTTVSRPIIVLTLYTPNTPATLVLKVLPTKSQALTKEIKEMKDVVEELEAEVAQYAVDKKHDAIEQKNLLIANDNLIAKFLSKEVFSVATNSMLNVARFTKMTVAHTDVEARCLELKAELAKLRNTSHHDNQEELINCFPKLELQVTRSDNDRTHTVHTADSQVTKLTEQVTNPQAQNNLFRAENDKIKQHYKELYDSIKITRAKHIEHVTALTIKNVNLEAQTLEKVNSVSKDQVKPKVLAQGKHVIDVEPIVPLLRNNRDAHLDYLRHLKESVETICDIVEDARVVRPLDKSIVSAYRYTKHSQELLEYAIDTLNSCLNASGSHPNSNTKTNRISPAKGVNKLPVKDQPRTNKSQLRTSNRVDSSSRLKRTVVQIVLWYLDSGCLKHMTVVCSWLMNFVKKFIGTVRFGNDHFDAIMGYGDYVIGDSVISRTVPITAQQNGVVERRNCTLVEAARTMLIFSKASLFLWAKVMATADFGALCYPTNDSEDLGKLQPTADIGIFVGYAPSRKGPAPNFLTLGQIKPPCAERPVPLAQAVQAPVNSAGTPSSTTIDKDAPSPSVLPSSLALQSYSLHQGIIVEPNYMEDHTVAPVDNNPFLNVFAPEPQSEASSSGDISST